MQENKIEVDEIINSSKNSIEEIIYIYKFNSNQCNKYDKKFLLADLKKNYPDSFKVMIEYKQEFSFKTVEKCLIRGINEGLFRTDIDVSFSAIFIIESLYQYLLDSNKIFKYESIDNNKALKNIIKILLFGLCNENGNKLTTELISKIDF